MPYKRKTVDEFNILSNYGYGHGWEVVTTELSRKDGLNQLKTYRDNDPSNPYKMVKKRVGISQ